MARFLRTRALLEFGRASRAAGWLLVLVFAHIILGAAASPVTAQVSGRIALSSLMHSVDGCEVTDTPGPQTVYVLHTSGFGGATGSRFKVRPGPGATITYVAEVHRFALSVGSTQTGVTICYDGACFGSTELLVSITYMGYGTSGNCSELEIVPHPDAETVEAMNCNFEPVTASVRNFRLNVGSGCGCPDTHSFSGAPGTFACSPVAVEETTWGKIKALYRR